MRKLFLLSVVYLFSLSLFGQNYEPARQTLRVDIGTTIFGDINKAGLYYANSYEYAFADHVAAEAFVQMAAHQSSSYVGEHANRFGTGINVIGRLYGLNNPFDVKLSVGARYGASSYVVLEEVGNSVIATDGDKHSGFSPILGLGYEQRLGDWLICLDFKASFEQSRRTYSNLSLGLGYRF